MEWSKFFNYFIWEFPLEVSIQVSLNCNWLKCGKKHVQTTKTERKFPNLMSFTLNILHFHRVFVLLSLPTYSIYSFSIFQITWWQILSAKYFRFYNIQIDKSIRRLVGKIKIHSKKPKDKGIKHRNNQFATPNEIV